MSYQKNTQVEVLPVVDFVKKIGEMPFFCGRFITGDAGRFKLNAPNGASHECRVQ